jgi:replicative DNA helicase
VSEHAELSVLSSVLLEPSLLDDVCAKLRPEDFTEHRPYIWRGILEARAAGLPLDLVILRDRVDKFVPNEKLAELVDYSATSANADKHVEIILSASLRRAVAEAAKQILTHCQEDELTSDELTDRAESLILEVGAARDRSTGPVSIDKSVHEALNQIELAAQRAQDGNMSGLPTGFKEFDHLTGGLQPGELVVIAARPSMGKTALAMNIAEYAATLGKRILVFSLEMTHPALATRMLSSRAGVDSAAIRRGWLSVPDHKRLLDAGGEVEKLPILIDDSIVRPSEIKARTRRVYSKLGLDAVIVDYLQLIRPDGHRRDRKDLEIADASGALKALAKELKIPVIALSQLNRGPEQRNPDQRRPMQADLRESGAIEQDADLIGFIFRPHVYDPGEPAEVAELIVAKQRNGPTGTVILHFDHKLARFKTRPPHVKEFEEGSE